MGALLLLVLVAGCNSSTPAPTRVASSDTYEHLTTARDVTIGAFTLSSLPGWDEGVTTTKTTRGVTYTNRDGLVGVEALEIDLKWVSAGARGTPRSVQDLQMEAKKALKGYSSLYQRSGITTKVLSTHPAKFNGMTALKTRYLRTSSATVTYGDITRFLDKTGFYRIESTITIDQNRAPFLPQFQATLGKALTVVNKQLKPAQSTAKATG